MFTTYIVTAEINMDASKFESITVRANTERKARIIAKEQFKKKFDIFHITDIKKVDYK